jgi:hypothetical protein
MRHRMMYSQFVGGKKASLDSVNDYRLEAYATLLFGVSSDDSSSCGNHLRGPFAKRDGAK